MQGEMERVFWTKARLRDDDQTKSESNTSVTWVSSFEHSHPHCYLMDTVNEAWNNTTIYNSRGHSLFNHSNCIIIRIGKIKHSNSDIATKNIMLFTLAKCY